MKKLLSLLLCLTFVLGIASVSVSAAPGEDVGETAELADTAALDESAEVGADTDVSDTSAVTPVNLGTDFYARVRMVRYKDYYLTVPSKTTDTPILRKLNEYNSQVWHFTLDGNAYRIRSVATNRYIEMSGSAVKEGAYLYHNTQSTAAAQKWLITQDATGYRIHSSVNDGYVMVCVNPTASSSRVVLTTAVNNARAYFSFEKLDITSDTLETPTLKLNNHVDGVQLSWNNVAHATQYRVYRYDDAGKRWVAIIDVKTNSYIDKTVQSGNAYTYTVKAISPVLSAYKGVAVTYIAAPVPQVNNTAKGPNIYWTKVAGAAAYKVFIHTGTQWKTLGSTTATSFLHEKFEYNKAYKYTVRCVSADGKTFTSAYYTDGITNTIVPTPAVKASIMPFSCDLSWAKIDGAAKYKVYFKGTENNYKWTELEDTAETKYSFAEALSNHSYYFTVRAMDANDRIISGFQSTKLVYFYEAPVIFDIEATSNTKIVSWYPVVGVASYRIFAWNGKQWVRKGDVSADTTSFSAPITGTDQQNTCYTVRCLDSNGKFISYFLETVIENNDLRYYYPGEYTTVHKF